MFITSVIGLGGKDADLTWNTDNPFFTPCFEITVLVWAPCVFLWVFIPLEIYYIISSKYANIPWGLLNIFRIVITVLVCAVTLSDLIMGIVRAGDGAYDVHIVTPAVKLISFLLTALLAYFHRTNGIMSSGLMFFFWFFLVLFGLPQYRTEIVHYMERSDRDELTFGTDEMAWADYQFLSYMIYYPLIVIQLVSQLFADNPPTKMKYEEISSKTLNPNPEIESSFIRKLLFIWFDPMTWRGFRNPLQTEDMWDIRPDDTSRELVPDFDRYWLDSVAKGERQRQKEKLKTNSKDKNSDSKSTRGSVIIPLFKSFGGPFFFAGFFKLLIDLLAFASPQVLRLLIAFTFSDDPLWHGMIFAVALFLVSFITSLLNGQYLYRCFLVGFRIRSVLISAIYRKALTISNSAKRDTTVGEIVNLMAVDAQRFFELIQYMHIIWSGPLVIALTLYFLWDILGVAVIAGLVVMLLSLPLNGYVANKLKHYQVKQMTRKDERVKLMNETLSGIKVLKLYAWEMSFQEMIQAVRNREVKVILQAAYMNAAWVSIVRINKFLNSEDLDPEAVQHLKDENALKIEDATFSWEGDDAVLKSINISVGKGSLAAVVGPVGSGKSSLISSILGETVKKSGTLNTDGTMAFVAQQAWIQNATLKDNILFGRPFDSAWYNKVIDACALTPDIKMLPGGDQTEIGEKGINLSGGQKQRVALARAVYSEAEIYLLDDPLSAVDSHVGKHIFEQVIGPNGILAGKTRLLITHGISYLPFVDTIYVMSHGEITENGRYDKLIAQKGAFADFIIEHLSGMEDDEELKEIKEALTPSVTGSIIFERAISVRSSDTKMKRASIRSSKRGGGKKKSLTDMNIIKPADDGRVLIQKEESATGSVGIGVYIRYFKSVGSLFSFVMLVGAIGNQAFSIYSNIWLSDWANDKNSTIPATRDLYLGVYGALGFLQIITLCATSFAMAVGCIYAARNLHDNLLNQTMRLPMAFFDTTPLGRIVNRFSRDVDVVDNILPQIIRFWIIMMFNTLAVFIVISIQTPIFMAVAVPIFILYYLMQAFYVATSRQLKRIESVTRSPVYSHFGETITGQSTIRAYNAESRFILDSEYRVDFNQKCTYPSIVANRWLGVRLELIGGLVIFFAALFAVLSRDTISGGEVGLSISYALQITLVLSLLVRMTAEVETNIVANERMEEYSNEKKEAEWVTKHVDPKWPANGEVKFIDYQVRYRENLDLVLKGVTFDIRGGEKVGIVGRTGAGKSSLTLALFRIIEAAGGKITIDGLDISDMGLHSLRSRLTIIPQDPVLFSGTLRMNIDPFNAYTDDDVWQALELAHLKSYAKDLDKGLLFEVAEGGENLSVGQRQLVCLARALLRKTKVLILDEATAAVDLETDDLIQKTIRSQFKECTVLTIAHRLNTIMDSDKVLVLDKGQVAEFASPQSLLDNRTTIFYGMCKDAGLVGAVQDPYGVE
ncbi:hypothetical protein HA402_015520 [Bradysia odoriphaga]|nr:hypothetical protein HA402_015520 [Bradysia odoriphaga]